MNEVFSNLMEWANSATFPPFPGLAEMPSTERTYPRNIILIGKNGIFLAWFLNWNILVFGIPFQCSPIFHWHSLCRCTYHQGTAAWWQTAGPINTSPSTDRNWILNSTKQRASLWIHIILMIHLQMLFYECPPLLLAFANSLEPSQMMKTIDSYGQPAMCHIYRVKGRHPLPQ